MIERITQLKNTLNELIAELEIACDKAELSPKIQKIGRQIFIIYPLEPIFVIVKKYLNAIESERLLNTYLSALRREAREYDVSDGPIAQGIFSLKDLKNAYRQLKSYSWFYYLFFKELERGSGLYANAFVDCLDSKSTAPLAKALIKGNHDANQKEINDNKKMMKKLKLNRVFKPKFYREFLRAFHKEIISWLDINFLANNFPENKINKEPLADKWESIEIRFKDDYDVKLIINGDEKDSNYEKLGFADKRQDSPIKVKYVKSWKILITFSTQNGRIKLNTFAGDKSKKELFKKDRLDLSKRLKNYFGLKDDPIIYDEKNVEYQIKIKLVPTPTFQEQWRDRHIIEKPREFLGKY